VKRNKITLNGPLDKKILQGFERGDGEKKAEAKRAPLRGVHNFKGPHAKGGQWKKGQLGEFLGGL